MSDEPPKSGAADPLSLSGVVPPTVTAFHDDGSLDTEMTAAHARFVVDRGAAAVFPLGTNGEFPLVTADERETIIDHVASEVGNEVPVIAGVGAPSTRETVANAEAAVDAGADGVVVVTPYYYPLDHTAAITHYRRVLDAVDVPTYVYHIPSKTGNELSLSTLSALAEAGVAGVKDSSKDVPWLSQAIDQNPELTFLVGSDSLLFPGLQIGCTGLVSAVANVYPELIVDLYEAYAEGKTERARDIQSTVYDVRDALKRGPYMAGVKTALQARDDAPDTGPLREPLRGMTAADRETLVAELDALEVA